jgi:hypothetical protein
MTQLSLTGSWGRREITRSSDDDYMVLFEGSSRTDARLPAPRQPPIVAGGGGDPFPRDR